jgi:hypothetical protein
MQMKKLKKSERIILDVRENTGIHFKSVQSEQQIRSSDVGNEQIKNSRVEGDSGQEEAESSNVDPDCCKMEAQCSSVDPDCCKMEAQSSSVDPD